MQNKTPSVHLLKDGMLHLNKEEEMFQETRKCTWLRETPRLRIRSSHLANISSIVNWVLMISSRHREATLWCQEVAKSISQACCWAYHKELTMNLVFHWSHQFKTICLRRTTLKRLRTFTSLQNRWFTIMKSKKSIVSKLLNN